MYLGCPEISKMMEKFHDIFTMVQMQKIINEDEYNQLRVLQELLQTETERRDPQLVSKMDRFQNIIYSLQRSDQVSQQILAIIAAANGYDQSTDVSILTKGIINVENVVQYQE